MLLCVLKFKITREKDGGMIAACKTTSVKHPYSEMGDASLSLLTKNKKLISFGVKQFAFERNKVPTIKPHQTNPPRHKSSFLDIFFLNMSIIQHFVCIKSSTKPFFTHTQTHMHLFKTYSYMVIVWRLPAVTKIQKSMESATASYRKFWNSPDKRCV